jgi:hypothetical protein
MEYHQSSDNRKRPKITRPGEIVLLRSDPKNPDLDLRRTIDNAPAWPVPLAHKLHGLSLVRHLAPGSFHY